MKKLRVLVADDHDDMRCLIADFLRKSFQVVGAVCDGEELVMSAGYLLPDVIVSDIVMPRMDGQAARNELIAQQRVIPFVFVTAYGKEIMDFLLKDSPIALVYKGEMLDHLNTAVIFAHSGRSYFSPHYCQ